MKIEIRGDCVRIDGYVNAVERESKVLHGADGAFVEKIKAGAFQRALDRAKRTGYDVKVLLNHDYTRELTTTRDKDTAITEDNIGLRCKCEIRDAEVAEKARSKHLSGWSFGFIPIKDEWKTEGDMRHREVRELELKEVSILDNAHTPAYNGTSIEMRSDDLIELRMMDGKAEIVDLTETKQTRNYKYRNKILATRASM